MIFEKAYHPARVPTPSRLVFSILLNDFLRRNVILTRTTTHIRKAISDY